MEFEHLKGIEIYTLVNDDSKIFAEYTVQGVDKTMPDVLKITDIDSPKFASYLRTVIIPNMDDKVTAKKIVQDIHDYINVYGCDDKIETKVRTAGKLSDDVIEYALYNNAQEYVRITKNGWDVVSSSKNKFIASAMSTEQIRPKKSIKNLIDLLSPYLNTDKHSMQLITAWLVQAFCEGDHHPLLISAPSGCGKSVLTEILRTIIDPAKADICAMNTKGDNLLTALTNSYLVAFDNTRTLCKDESDILCIAVTGGTYSKREAFSTNTNAVFRLHNSLILNGIDIIPTESDFAQRCLLLKLKAISPQKRLLKSEINKRFAEDLPYILGAIFDTLSKAMHVIHTVKISEKSRMADAQFEMLAISIALGLSQEDFQNIYQENKSELDRQRSKTELFYAVLEYMNKIDGNSVEGTVSQVFAKISNSYSGGKSALPKSPSQFSRKLNSEFQTFLAAGIRINLDDTFADGTHIKIIKK